MFFLLLVFTHILHTTFYICSRILFWLHRIYAFSFTNTSIILFFCFLAFFLFLFLAIHTKIALFHYRPQRIFLLRHFLLKFFAKNSFFLIHASKYSSVHFVHFHKHKNPPKNQKKKNTLNRHFEMNRKSTREKLQYLKKHSEANNFR